MNDNLKPQNNSEDKFSNLKDKFDNEFKQAEEKLNKEFEENLSQNFETDKRKEDIIENAESIPTFKNSYTEKLNNASQKREEALKKGSNKYIKYSSIGVEMIGSVILGGFLGNWLDKKIEIGFPLFTITLILLGLGATFTHLIMQLNADNKKEEEKRKKAQD
ncbi:hypothetical protein Fleli_0572 [Bernardetia litoralis DSM 6794]|uniref:ATP synthase protein I n=1 Tax=Bernardetia litoralis (strain ATCC 23117 / DSM 6794 / NBRC 15988 / NCIMB 1366 / Fx l1 / Sio-4) TaxID=880071 RepID=I4AGF3_BERLS|nr:AtpZ/AtpI family protein [Bernardetia litoralis]AFM03038.1 hypothetical protein Fleli_0572 [Bernardetia litoralis DSM 6794]